MEYAAIGLCLIAIIAISVITINEKGMKPPQKLLSLAQRIPHQQTAKVIYYLPRKKTHLKNFQFTSRCSLLR